MHKPVPGKPGTYAAPPALRCGLPRWCLQHRPALRVGRCQRHAGWCGWFRARGGAAGRTGALVSAWRGRAFGRPRGSGADSLLPSLARLQWLADTPALELRCGLPRWYMRGKPALRMTDAVRDRPGCCGWIRARGGAAGRTGALVATWRGRAFGRPRGSAAQAACLTPSGGGCGAASAGVRGRPGCRSGWWTGSCGPAASAGRAGRRRG